VEDLFNPETRELRAGAVASILRGEKQTGYPLSAGVNITPDYRKFRIDQL